MWIVDFGGTRKKPHVYDVNVYLHIKKYRMPKALLQFDSVQCEKKQI